MGRHRIYGNDTERQRAWRERLKAQAAGQVTAAVAPVKGRRLPSRPARLAALLTALQQLQTEYEHWLAALPESLADSPIAERLTETVEQFQDAAEMLSAIDPPQGYGRD